jgi:DNA polymerase-3 subunit delta
MVKILIGTNQFLIEQALKKLIKNKNYHKFFVSNGNNLHFFQIRQAFITNSLFGEENDVVIIDDFQKLSLDDLEKLFKFGQNLPKQKTLVLIQKNADKRKLKKWKKFSIFEYNELENYKIQQYIHLQIKNNNLKLSKEAINYLCQAVGNDLHKINQEVQKLVAYQKNNQIINEKEIINLIAPIINPSIFNLIDQIGMKSSKNALKELNNLLENGEYPLYVLTMIIYGFRNLVLIKILWQKGFSSKQIVSKLKIHPFVVNKNINLINKFSLSELYVIYRKLLNAEIAIKTGKKDPKFVIEMLVSFLSR